MRYLHNFTFVWEKSLYNKIYKAYRKNAKFLVIILQ